MKQIKTLALCIAATAAMLTLAEARDGCGQGWFFNGVACAPMERGYGYGPPPGYGVQPYFAPPQRYAPEPHYYDQGPRGGGGGGGDMYRGRDGQLHCRNPRFTIQDGQCKPYSGR